MLNLLKVDFYKMLKSLTFRIVGIILIAFTVLAVWLYSFALDISHTNGSSLSINVFDGTFYLFISVMSLWLPISASNFVCSEFSNGTIKNVVSKGYSREKIFLSKFIMSIVATVLYMICMFVTYLVIGGVFLIGKSVNMFSMSQHFVYRFGILFLYIVAMIAFSMLLALIFKRPWLVLLIFVFAPSILKLFVLTINFNISAYFLSSNLLLLIDPLNGIPSRYLLRVILVPIVYWVVSLGAGIYIFRKHDI